MAWVDGVTYARAMARIDRRRSTRSADDEYGIVMTVPDCPECGMPVERGDEYTEDDDGRPYHWACLQERYEREHLAADE